MADTEVQVIKATEGPIVRDRRLVGTPLTIQRKRVAAYVRVSTDGRSSCKASSHRSSIIRTRFQKTRNGQW